MNETLINTFGVDLFGFILFSIAFLFVPGITLGVIFFGDNSTKSSFTRGEVKEFLWIIIVYFCIASLVLWGISYQNLRTTNCLKKIILEDKNLGLPNNLKMELMSECNFIN